MTPTEPIYNDLSSRFHRQESIPGWSQPILASARVLVAGAGTIGNETLKNLALLGIGTVAIVDRDLVEAGNLCRSVLYRSEDVGHPKAYAAANRLRQLNPELSVEPFDLDLTTDLGAGLLAQYDLVLGCLDSIEARWRLNRLCCSANVPWIDAGIDAAMGQISFFAAGHGPCYECGMTESMWQRIHERRSCLLAQKILPDRPIPTTIAIASLIASMQVQEAIAQLHQSTLAATPWPVLQAGDKVSIALSPYTLSVLHTKRRHDCLAHTEPPSSILSIDARPQDITANELMLQCESEGLDLDWDVALGLRCPTCGVQSTCIPGPKLNRADLVCPDCEGPRTPDWQSRLTLGSEAAQNTLSQLGVPPLAYLRLFTKDGHHVTATLIES